MENLSLNIIHTIGDDCFVFEMIPVRITTDPNQVEVVLTEELVNKLKHLRVYNESSNGPDEKLSVDIAKSNMR